MKIIVDKLLLQGIYSSAAKIFISGQDSIFFAENFEFTDQIALYEFHYDLSAQQGRISLLGARANAPVEEVEMKLAPNFCLGLLAFSTLAQADLEKFICWWSARSIPESLPPLIEFDPKQDIKSITKDFWQQMYGQMARQNHAIANRIGTLQKQYLELRTLHENMQNAFAVVEDYLTQAKLPALQLVFDHQPSEEEKINPYELANSQSLKQLLPVSAPGLAVVELHIAEKDESATGYLQVGLKACEDKNCFVTWQIPYQQLPQGWLGLDLPQIDLGRQRDVELIVEWHTNLGPAPSLSLGSRQTIPELQVYADGMAFDHSLAFRIWHGLPGTRKVTSPYLVTLNNHNDADCESLTLGYLGQGAMARVKEVTPNLPADETPYIQVIDQGAKILTRPRPDGSPTIAMLPFCFPPTANNVTATVITGHPEADLIEYALVIMSQDSKSENLLREDLILASSGWVRVEANIPRQISVSLTSLLKEHCHIVIAARLAAHSIAAYADTYWLNFNLAHNSETIEPNLAAKPAFSVCSAR